jgi:hypothetical protein
VTGLEAANAVVAACHQGHPADILPIIPDEPHIQWARSLNQGLKSLFRPWS